MVLHSHVLFISRRADLRRNVRQQAFTVHTVEAVLCPLSSFYPVDVGSGTPMAQGSGGFLFVVGLCRGEMVNDQIAKTIHEYTFVA
jgi:hypothetical protein